MNDSLNHYFTNSDENDFVPFEIDVTLGGRDLKVFTSRSVFSADQLDRGTSVLINSLDSPIGKNILDIGCGWGAIAIDSALRAPDATVWAVDVNHRALSLTQKNVEKLGLENVRVSQPSNVPENIVFDEIRSNPPIRVGKSVLHEILREWVPRLSNSGVAYLVVAKQLGADSLKRWISETWPELNVSVHYRKKGFHVIRASRSNGC